MSDTYTQYFTSHVHDMEWRLKESENETLAELAEIIPLSGEQKLDLADCLTRLRSLCCSESFALGIELGLRIAWEFPVK